MQPTNGQLISNGAIGGFVGADGEGIEWEKQKDGSYKNKNEVKVPLAFDEKGKPQGEVLYTYGLTPKGEFLEVSVAKQKLLTKEQKESIEVIPGAPGNPQVTPVPEKETKKKSK